MDILTDFEQKIASLYGAAANLYLMKQCNMTRMQAIDEYRRIKAKQTDLKQFEGRQVNRYNKINAAKIQASIRGTNELIIMSEV